MYSKFHKKYIMNFEIGAENNYCNKIYLSKYTSKAEKTPLKK